MENIILKKENGIVTRGGSNTLVSNKSYLTEGETCFDCNKCDFVKEDIQIVKRMIESMVYTIGRTSGGSAVINEFYIRLKSVQTMEEVINILKLFCNAYDKISKIRKSQRAENAEEKEIREKYISRFSEQIEKNPELMVSTFTKKIVGTRYLNSVLSLGTSEINELHKLKISGASIDEMLDILGETFDDELSANGIENLSKKVFSDTIDTAFIQAQAHLCWEDCKNATVYGCRKVGDDIKRPIGKYDFITDGLQIISPNGEVERFIVTGCKNYEREQEKKLTVQEKARLKKIKEGLIMAYFDATTLEEAYVTQADLESRGQLSNVRGRRPSTTQINKMRSEIRRKK